MLLSQNFQPSWSNLNKIILRILFTYFTIFIALLFLSPVLEGLIRWFGQSILRWDNNFILDSTGSGDRAFDYARLGFNILITIPIVTIWSYLDRNRKSFNQLFYWFQTFLRLSLFLAMLLYGFSKIFKGQFQDPGLLTLLQPVGSLSPMKLAWTFMGHSFAYNLFIGLAEILGGILIIFRRTLTLGALTIFGVMSNVVFMNFTYDIPVKVFSVHLTLMALVLLIVDGRRLIDFFILNKPIERNANYRPNRKPVMDKLVNSGKKLVTAVISGIFIIQCFVQFNATAQLQDKSGFYGIWEIQYQIENGDTIPPLTTESKRWRYLVVDKKREAFVIKINDSIIKYDLDYMSDINKLTLTKNSVIREYAYEFSNSDNLIFNELKDLESNTLEIHLVRKNEKDFRLLNRGFHWVNEYPYMPN